jgi:hypothetical protein
VQPHFKREPPEPETVRGAFFAFLLLFEKNSHFLKKTLDKGKKGEYNKFKGRFR